MAHKTKINGTTYNVSGGKTLIGSTAYSIKGGKTLVGGTGYNVGFAKPVRFLVTGNDIYSSSYYNAIATYSVSIYVNGTRVNVNSGDYIDCMTGDTIKVYAQQTLSYQGNYQYNQQPIRYNGTIITSPLTFTAERDGTIRRQPDSSPAADITH